MGNDVGNDVGNDGIIPDVITENTNVASFLNYVFCVFVLETVLKCNPLCNLNNLYNDLEITLSIKYNYNLQNNIWNNINGSI